MHAREHLTAEQCLYLVHLLTDNYGAADAARPARDEHRQHARDLDHPHAQSRWRRCSTSAAARSTAGARTARRTRARPRSASISTATGATCGAAAAARAATRSRRRYRGQYPFEAVEDQVLRDFILSRRVGGVQQIKEVLNVHSYGEHVLYPYGYTKDAVPPDMTQDDHDTFVALAQQMASLNGYHAMQGSQMYIYDGDFIDWAYGDQHIFAFTWEMYPGVGLRLRRLPSARLGHRARDAVATRMRRCTSSSRPTVRIARPVSPRRTARNGAHVVVASDARCRRSAGCAVRRARLARRRARRWACAANDFPSGYHGLPRLRRDDGRHRRRHRRPSEHRRQALDRPELRGPHDLGGQDQRQRRRPTRTSPRCCSSACTTRVSTSPVEQALEIIHLLADNYRTVPRRTSSSASPTSSTRARSGSCPMVNPDGAEYDITSGQFQNWRKQPSADPRQHQRSASTSTATGATCGAAAAARAARPGTTTYRGPSPWFAPEVGALRDFVLSRRVGGQQQITEAISWHTLQRAGHVAVRLHERRTCRGR